MGTVGGGNIIEPKLERASDERSKPNACPKECLVLSQMDNGIV